VKPREEEVHVVRAVQVVPVDVDQAQKPLNNLLEDVDGHTRQEVKVFLVIGTSEEALPRVKEIPCSQEHFDLFTMRY
jgi:hypothetical protein